MPRAMSLWRALAGILLVGLATAGGAAASTQAPTFARADHSQLGSNHVAEEEVVATVDR